MRVGVCGRGGASLLTASCACKQMSATLTQSKSAPGPVLGALPLATEAAPCLSSILPTVRELGAPNGQLPPCHHPPS
jgi:hypothetical protein